MRIRMHRYAISRKIQFLTGKGNELIKLIQLPVLIKITCNPTTSQKYKYLHRAGQFLLLT